MLEQVVSVPQWQVRALQQVQALELVEALVVVKAQLLESARELGVHHPLKEPLQVYQVLAQVLLFPPLVQEQLALMKILLDLLAAQMGLGLVAGLVPLAHLWNLRILTYSWGLRLLMVVVVVLALVL